MDNQPLLWTGPRRVCMLSYSSACLARRVAGHRASSVIRHLMHPGPDPLDYATPRPPGRRLADNVILLALLAVFMASVVCVVVTMGHLKEVHHTPQFSLYLATQAAQAASRPASPRPPFVGQAFVPVPVWCYPTTYGALLCPAVFVAMVVHDLRSRQPGRAG